jgi:Na+/melibiose symporter-like transporter
LGKRVHSDFNSPKIIFRDGFVLVAQLQAPPRLPTAGERLSIPQILAFSATSIPLGGVGVGLTIFLQPYFASRLHIPLMVVAGAWFTVRMLDFGIDVILGLLMDRFSTRWGRYRIWFVAGMPILMLSIYQLFMAPMGIDGGYLVLWLFVYYLGNSIVTLAHLAWRATLVTNYNERSRVYGLMAPMSIVGALVTLLIPWVAQHTGNAAHTVQWIGLFAVFTLPFAAAVVVLFTREPIAPEVERPPGIPWRDYWELVKNPSFLRLLIGEAFLVLGPGWMSALYIFFFEHSRGFATAQSSALLAVYVLAGLIGAPAAAWLAIRIGKHRTLFATTTAYSIGLCTVMFVPYGNMIAALPTMLWCGFMAAGFGLMTSAMTADFGDEIRLEQGKERITLIYSFTGLMAKLAAAGAGVFSFAILAWIGFNPAEGATNTPAAIRGLELTYVVGPIFCVMIGGACFLGWRLTADRHADIRSRLDERDAELAAARPPATSEPPGLQAVAGELE